MSLPFDLPALSRGFAELTPAARAAAREAAAGSARTLSGLIGRDVALTAVALPGAPPARIAVARLGLELAAVPAAAVLEVEPALVVRLVDVLSGGRGPPVGATALTPIETSALDLLALAALDGAASATIERALAPRLARAVPDVPGALAIEVGVAAGDVAGRVRLLVPPAAVRALRNGAADPDAAAASIGVPASLRSGQVALAADELELLAPGDVVLVDAAEDGRERLVFPGGAAIRGRREEDAFHVEEMAMADRTAALPLTLEVELARVVIPAGELARLEPGAVLTLPIDRRGLVALRAGERAVARGELVDVDGAVGVRVLSIEVAP